MAKRPSAPKKLAKYYVSCELGHRLYSETFMDKAEASAFVHAVIKDEPLRWKSPVEATAKGGVLVVKCEEGLEDLVDMKPGELDQQMTRAVHEFLGGHWPPKDAHDGQRSTHDPKAKTTVVAKKATGKPGLVTLAEMCERNKWVARAVRMKLRAEKIKKPGSEWAWPSSEANKVEKKLKELMS